MNTARQWSDRCFLEMQDHDQTWFVTLTYDDETVPVSYYVDDSTGEYFKSATLRKRHFQLFMKRLRRNTGQKIRFFACGEYGDRTARPHYHAILFGLDLPLSDLRPYKRNDLGQMMYNSCIIDEAWNNECFDRPEDTVHGFCVVAPATYETISYTCRYVLKKAYGNDRLFYEKHGIEPVFTLMSRKPGLGRRWFEEHEEELFNFSGVYIPTADGSKKILPGRYFKNLYSLDYPDEYAIMQEENRIRNVENLKVKMKQTDLDLESQLKVEESALTNRLRALPRKEV